MRSDTRRRLSMAKRARDFAATNPVADPGFATVFQRLNAAVTQADAIAMQQGDGQRDELAARSHRQALGLAIRRTYLARLCSIAKLAEQSHPELKERFLMPDWNLPTKTFLIAARSLLGAAVEHEELFVSFGLGPSFLKDSTTAVDELAKLTEAVHAGRSDHILASTDLENIVRDTRIQVRVLDTYYRAAYPDTSDVLAAWRSAKKVPGAHTPHLDVTAAEMSP